MSNSIADQLLALMEETKHDFFLMDDGRVSRQRSGGKWSAKQELGHLIDSALNNHQRIIRAQQAEHTVLSGYDQDFWVNANAYHDRSWDEVVVLWRKFNRFLAEVIRNIPEAKLANKLTIGDADPVSLEFVIEDYLRHVRHHIAQIHDLCR